MNLQERINREPDSTLRLRNTLNIVFIVLVVATVALYFLLPQERGIPAYFVTCFVAVLVKGVEVCIRMIHKHKQHDTRRDHTA